MYEAGAVEMHRHMLCAWHSAGGTAQQCAHVAVAVLQNVWGLGATGFVLAMTNHNHRPFA
jgi:hypothetical protein